MSGTDAVWSLRLLDHFSLRGPNGDAGLTARKAVALVIFLALQRDRMARRDQVANMLWSSVDTAQGRVNLRQAIAAIRRVEGGSPLLTTEPDTIALAESVMIDIDAFARLASGDLADRAAAADLYRTDLVTGFALRDEPAFNEWLTIAQAHWRQRAVDVLLSLSEAALAPPADANAGITAALKLLAIDPFNEAGHRTLMRLYVRQGRAALALAQYRSLADLLRRELQVAPDAETQALYERVKGGRRQPAPATTASAPSAAPVDPLPPDPIDVQMPEDVVSPQPSPSRRHRTRWRWMAASAAGVGALIAGYAVWQAADTLLDRSPVIASVFPITASDDDERLPAISPDGSLVVYGSRKAGNVDLYMTALESGGEPLRLTDHPAIDTQAAWRPDGRAIAFVRYDPGANDPCTIFVRPLPVGTERQVGRCLNSSQVSLNWSSDGSTIYFDDDQSPTVARRIFALDAGTGAVRPVSALATDAHGDYRPVVSHDGRYVAYQRRREATSDLMVQDLSRGTVTVVRRGVAGLHDHGWSAGDGGLFYTVSLGADAGLWWAPLRTDAAPVRLSSGLTRYMAISAAASGRKLAIQVSQDRTDVLRIGPDDAKAAPLTGFPGLGSGGFDRLIVQARDGRVAFVSTRNGAEQLWTVRSGQGPQALTTAAGIAFSWLAWSPDGRTIAAAGTVAGRSSILLIDTGDGSIRRIPASDAVDGYPAWSADGTSLYWSSLRNSGSGLMRLRLPDAKRIERVMTGQVALARFSPDGRFVYFVLIGRTGLYRRTLDASGVPVGPTLAILPQLGYESRADWTITDSAILYPLRTAGGRVELRRNDLAGGQSTVVDVESDHLSSLSASPGAGGGAIVVRARRQNDISGMDFN